MSISRFDALLATSEHMTAVIRFGAGVRGSIAPNVNCGIFDSEPDGVMPVSAVLLAAISARTRISGIEAAPSSHGTPNHSCAIHTPTAPTTGTPTQETGSGSSMWRRTSLPPGVERPRRTRLRKASAKTSGFANSVTMAATTIMVMPHHRAQLFRMYARPKRAVPSAIEPARGSISPIEIMIGTTTTKLSTAPSSRLAAARIPIRPPAPIIAKSRVGESASWRMSTPASFGNGASPLSTSE